MDAHHAHQTHAPAPTAAPVAPPGPQLMQFLAMLNGLAGSVTVSMMTALVVMGAMRFYGPEMWVTIASLWAGWGVLQAALIVGSLKE